MKKILNIYSKVLIFISSLLLIGILFCVVLAVLNRAVFKVSMFWTEEMARILFVWFAFVSTGIIVIDETYFEMKFFYNKIFTGKAERIAALVISVIIALTLVYYVIWGYRLSGAVVNQQLPTIRASMSFLYASVPVGLGLAVGAFILKTIEKISLILRQGKTNN